MIFTQRFNGRPFRHKAGRLFRFACCDCGLVHDLAAVIGKGKHRGTIEFVAMTNRRLTALRRRRPQKMGPRA